MYSEIRCIKWKRDWPGDEATKYVLESTGLDIEWVQIPVGGSA